MQKNIRKLILKSTALALWVGMSACSHSSSATSGSGSLKTNSFPAMSKSALIESLKIKGNYQGVQTSQIDGRYEVVTTSGDEKFFIKGDRLVSNSRNPTEQEKTLIYWRGKFRGKAYRETPLSAEVISGHERPMLELACDTLGTGVVYDPSREQVKRVFYYEAK